MISFLLPTSRRSDLVLGLFRLVCVGNFLFSMLRPFTYRPHQGCAVPAFSAPPSHQSLDPRDADRPRALCTHPLRAASHRHASPVPRWPAGSPTPAAAPPCPAGRPPRPRSPIVQLARQPLELGRRTAARLRPRRPVRCKPPMRAPGCTRLLYKLPTAVPAPPCDVLRSPAASRRQPCAQRAPPRGEPPGAGRLRGPSCPACRLARLRARSRRCPRAARAVHVMR